MSQFFGGLFFCTPRGGDLILVCGSCRMERMLRHKVPTYTHHTGCSISGGVVLVIDRRSGLGYIEKQVAGNDNDVTGIPIIHMHHSVHVIL